TGTAVVPNELTAVPASVSGGGITNTWQWKRDGVDITGETLITYTLTEDDYETDISVVQTATNTIGSDSAESDPVPIPAQVTTPPNYFHTTITVGDGNANTFVYEPENLATPPPGGWPLVVVFLGDGTSNSATTKTTNTAISTSDNLTYTHTPTVWYGTVKAAEGR